jgi:RNA polymerase sigma-70 factor (ECF subfamily)
MFQDGSTNGPISATSASERAEQFQEADLVRQAQLGSHEAFSSLFAHYNQQICTYLLRLVNNPEVAYDLAQDTFLAAWQALPLMPVQMFFRPWLYKIATNKAVSWWRRDKQINWSPWEKQERISLAPAEFEEQVVLTDLIQRVLCTLPDVQRACLLLQSIAGFKIHEIAQILAMKPKTVSVYISRAREQFRQIYTGLQNNDPQGLRKEDDTNV